MQLDLPDTLLKALQKEALDACQTLSAHITNKLVRITPHIAHIKIDRVRENLPELVAFISRVPSVRVLSSDITPDAYWWIKLRINVSHPLAWQAVQELAFVLNALALSEPLPTIFKPVSPPPYLNPGGPQEMLSWVIESTYNYIDPAHVLHYLDERLPNPVDDENAWISRNNDDEVSNSAELK